LFYRLNFHSGGWKIKDKKFRNFFFFFFTILMKWWVNGRRPIEVPRKVKTGRKNRWIAGRMRQRRRLLLQPPRKSWNRW
jgi:hypothetical protein